MLATRIIPTLLCRGRQLVKGKMFKSWRSIGLVTQAVRIHQARGVDELILLDIGATMERRGPDLELIKELTEGCFMPITVGGGVTSIKDVEALLNAGADKVAIGSAAQDMKLVESMAKRFGCQAIVASVDYRRSPYGPAAYIHNGDHGYGNAVALAVNLANVGAGEILLTCIDREGTLHGYDINTLAEVCERTSVPVIAHGGCGMYQDMYAAVKAGAHAVAAGAMFQFTEQTPRGAAEYLKAQGVEVRLEPVG